MSSSPVSLSPTLCAQQPQAGDLRRMTSNLGSPTRQPQRGPHITDTRLGSRSPNSIPSSPTSVHSSSSAIFERDIEPPVITSPPATLPHPPPNPHRVLRANSTEQSVPSVLDSAASILASIDDTPFAEDLISVVAPASRSSGFASPLSYRRVHWGRGLRCITFC